MLEKQLPTVSPDRLLCRAQEICRAKGLLGLKLSLERDGQLYRAACDERTFTVYRVNREFGAAHGAPGWLVCLVDGETVFEDRSEEAGACLSAGEWLACLADWDSPRR